MIRDNKGMEIFLAGMMISVVTYFLGALNTGAWIPVVVNGVELMAFAMMLMGIRQFAQRHSKFKTASRLMIVALLISGATAVLYGISMNGIGYWMAVVAMALVLLDHLTYIFLMGLVLLGISGCLIEEGRQREAGQISYLWTLFLVFAILNLLFQIAGILLANEGLTGLTYLVPAMGLPVLLIGLAAVLWIYRLPESPEAAVQ